MATQNVGLSSVQSGYGALEFFKDGGSNCVTWSYAKPFRVRLRQLQTSKLKNTTIGHND